MKMTIVKRVNSLCWTGLAAVMFSTQGVDAKDEKIETSVADYSAKGGLIAEDEWEFALELYGWGANISGRASTGEGLDTGLDDILNNLNMTFMGSVGARKGKWGIQADFVYLNVSEKVDEPLAPGVTVDDVNVKNWIITPMLTYQVHETDSLDLNLLAGARCLYLKATLDVSPLGEFSDSGSAWDAIVGVNGEYHFNDKWYVPFHLDIGAGQTDLTWQVFAGVGYRFEYVDVIVGYRHLDWSFDSDGDGGDLISDLTVSGPIAGVKFRF